MGSALGKKYDLPPEPSASAGHCGLWKIWNGKSLETGEIVSVWTFDKNDLLKRKMNPITDKSVAEQIMQIMKKDLFNLQDKNSTSEQLIIKEIVEESKSTIVFATEPIICSLADIFSNFHGKSNLNSDSFESGVLSEIEISRGILNLAEGIQYFHTIQKKLHLNISPDSIIITVEGKWKFCSFGLSLTHSGEMGIGRLPSPYFLKASFNDDGNDNRKIKLEPDLSYSCPEMTVGGLNPPNVRYLTTAADVFSLGILAYELYQFNLKSKDSRFHSRCIVSNNLMNHKEAIDKLIYLDFSCVSFSLKNLLLNMIQAETSKRLSIADIINNSYFSSGSLAILKNIDTLHMRDIASQSTFLVGLSNQLEGFPVRILQNSVLPTICKICNSNAALWMYVLPIHQFISKKIKISDYINIALPYIAKGLSIITPTEVMQIFMKNINWLMETFNNEFFKDHILTLVCNGLDIQNEAMQTQTLVILCKNEELRKAIDQKCLTDLILPKVCKEACKNNVPNIKILALYFLSLVNSRIDKTYLGKFILPSLQYIIDNEKNPLVSMSVIGNYEVMSLSVGAEYIATQILPTIQPLLIDRSLNKQQFQLVVCLVRTLISIVLKKRTVELEMEPILFADSTSNLINIDPFQHAKKLLADFGMKLSTDTIIGKSSISSTNSSVFDLPPPPPLSALPPPPLSSAPLPPSTPLPSLGFDTLSSMSSISSKNMNDVSISSTLSSYNVMNYSSTNQANIMNDTSMPSMFSNMNTSSSVSNTNDLFDEEDFLASFTSTAIKTPQCNNNNNNNNSINNNMLSNINNNNYNNNVMMNNNIMMNNNNSSFSTSYHQQTSNSSSYQQSSYQNQQSSYESQQKILQYQSSSQIPYSSSQGNQNYSQTSQNYKPPQINLGLSNNSNNNKPNNSNSAFDFMS